MSKQTCWDTHDQRFLARNGVFYFSLFSALPYRWEVWSLCFKKRESRFLADRCMDTDNRKRCEISYPISLCRGDTNTFTTRRLLMWSLKFVCGHCSDRTIIFLLILFMFNIMIYRKFLSNNTEKYIYWCCCFY